MFCNGDNFCGFQFDFQNIKLSKKRRLCQKKKKKKKEKKKRKKKEKKKKKKKEEEFVTMRSKFLPFRVDSFSEGEQSKSDRFISPESE